MTFAIQEVSAEEWATFIDSRPDAHVLQHPAWGMLKSQFGWDPQRVLVVGSSGPVAGAQVLWRSQWGLKMAYVPRGPLWGEHPLANQVLIAGLQRLVRRRHAVFLRLEPNALDTPTWHAMHSELLLADFLPTAPMQPEASIHLALNAPADTLFAGFSKGHRADVWRAERLGVTVRTGTTPADFAAFYAVMEATAARAQFGIHTAAYYRAAWELFGGSGESGAARLFLADHEGVTVAAFLVFGFGSEAHYMYSGSTEAGMKVGANHALQWAAIRWAQERGCRLYDFWGIPEAFLALETASDPAERTRLEALVQATGMAGVYRFKKGWGGIPVRYVPAYDWVVLKPIYWLWQRRRGT